MSSRGHFLLIRVSIYQNVCIHEQISKMVPAILKVKRKKWQEPFVKSTHDNKHFGI